MNRKRRLFMILFFLLLVVSCKKETQTAPVAVPKARRQEGYPARIIASLNHQSTPGGESPLHAAHFQQVISSSRRWIPGSAVSVAFLGGSSQIRRQIMQAVTAWTTKVISSSILDHQQVPAYFDNGQAMTRHTQLISGSPFSVVLMGVIGQQSGETASTHC